MPYSSDRIYLTGFMGAGKTTIGKLLAQKMGFLFFDLDEFIEQEEGLSITQLFDQRGEQTFRYLEARALRRTRQFERVVVACGGGAPCFWGGMNWMNEHGLTIYLKVSVASLAKRLGKEGKNDRPLLLGQPAEQLEAWIREKLEGREPVYEMARITVDLEDQAEAITEFLQNQLTLL
jgi:shikimate kinase